MAVMPARGGMKAAQSVIIVVAVLTCAVAQAGNLFLEKGLQRDLRHSLSVVRKARETGEKGSSMNAEVNELKAQLDEIEASDILVREEFRARAGELKDLGGKALGRHFANDQSIECLDLRKLVSRKPPSGEAGLLFPVPCTPFLRFHRLICIKPVK
jgi:hypothetical protein